MSARFRLTPNTVHWLRCLNTAAEHGFRVDLLDRTPAPHISDDVDFTGDEGFDRARQLVAAAQVEGLLTGPGHLDVGRWWNHGVEEWYVSIEADGRGYMGAPWPASTSTSGIRAGVPAAIVVLERVVTAANQLNGAGRRRADEALTRLLEEYDSIGPATDRGTDAVKADLLDDLAAAVRGALTQAAAELPRVREAEERLAFFEACLFLVALSIWWRQNTRQPWR